MLQKNVPTIFVVTVHLDVVVQKDPIIEPLVGVVFQQQGLSRELIATFGPRRVGYKARVTGVATSDIHDLKVIGSIQ